jgi:hydrogenase maturation protease
MRRGSVRLLVCGNPHRRDDGAALRAAALLVPSLRLRHCPIEAVRCGQLDVDHLLSVPPGMPVVLLDAAVGVPPGSIVVRSLDELIDQPGGAAPHSSHALPINQVLGMANVLADQPLRGVFVGIGGADFGYGDALSPAVQASLPAYRDAITAEVTRIAAGLAAGRPSRVGG